MKTTFSRTFSSVAFLLLASLLLVGVAFRLLARNFLTDAAVADLKNDASAIVRMAQAGYSDGVLNDHDFIVALSISDEVSGNDAVIFGANGNLMMCSNSPLGCEHRGMPLGEEYRKRIVMQGIAVDTCVLEGLYGEKDVRYVVAMPIAEPETGAHLGVVLVSAPTATTMAVLQRITEIYLFVSVFVVLVCVVLMTLFARHQSSPLKDMADAARAFGHGDLTARVKTDGNHPREIEELALAFNNMAAEIEKSDYQRREFVANVSHELKTPMTTISGYVDGILDGTIPPQRRDHYLQVVSDETKRLNRLVRSMLDVSRLQDQGGVPEEQRIQFDLCECMGRVLITFEQKITEKNLDIQVEMPADPVYTVAHQDYITQVIYNLVDNAVKFCPKGGVLALKIQEGSSKAYVSVANDGPTIPPEELPLVFDRFHKTDKSRAQNRDSWGLGLYIVKTIVCSHGEDISVTSRDGRTTFTFTMPLVN